jgi:hypothetical protein
MKKLNATLLFLGLGLLTFLIWKVGPAELVKEVQAVGWGGVMALILAEGAGNLAHSLGWRYCLGRSGPPVSRWRLFRMAMAGFAMNYLLPLASVGGEASKAALLMSSRSSSEALGSVLLDKLATAIAHLLLALLGASLVVWYARLPVQMVVAMVVSTVLLAGGIGIFLLLQRHGKLGSLLRWLVDRQLGGGLLRQVSRRLSDVDCVLRRFYNEQPMDLLRSVAWHLLGHSAGLIQAWLFLRLGRQPTALLPVACAGLLSLWFDLLTFAIPLNLGGLEGSRMVALKAIGNNAATGIAFGISLRIAQLFWVGFGLVSYLLFWPIVRTTAARCRTEAPREPESGNCFYRSQRS